MEAYCLRSIFSRLDLVSGRLENLENASGVHLLCMGVTNEARAQVTLASNSFMKIFWACNSITRELNLAVWTIYSQFDSIVGL